MLSKKDIGDIGEKRAVEYLSGLGYQILETNWRYKRAEIDVIAKTDEILVFVEVKTRSYAYYGQPSEAVDKRKEALLMDAAQRYMESIDYEWEIRFDIISIILNESGSYKKLDHFEDAFF